MNADSRIRARTRACGRIAVAPSVALIVLFSLLAGCATMEVPKSNAGPADSYPLKVSQGGLLVAVHPVTDNKEMRQAFNYDLLRDQILPLLIVAENQSPSSNFVLRRDKVAVVDAKSPKPIDTALGQVTSGTGGQIMATVGGAILNLPLLIGGLKISSDAEIVQYNLCDKEWYSHTLGPGQRAYGYLYVHLPPKTNSLHGRVILDVVDSTSGQTMAVDLPFTYNQR